MINVISNIRMAKAVLPGMRSRKSGDENNILVVLEGDPDAMKNFLASADLGEKMKEAGVLAPPETFSGEKL